MNTSICKKEHRYSAEFKSLPYDQSSSTRHKCCGCAYDQGLLDGKAGKKAKPEIQDWPVSQAGTGRHKSATEAYSLGYQEGSRR